jgi:ubiquinone/menaquinone biosynthesis C-methylase UbiE
MKMDLAEIAQRTLTKIGVCKGKTILDFGCGSGTYSIPAAKIAGTKGVVYALDKDKKNLDKLTEKAESQGLKNIKRVRIPGGTKIPFDKESVDIILLYDVFHSYYFSRAERRKLLKEISRILKPDGFLSVWPKHLEIEAEKEIENAKFYLESKHTEKLIHDDLDVEKGEILNFKKRNKGKC